MPFVSHRSAGSGSALKALGVQEHAHPSRAVPGPRGPGPRVNTLSPVDLIQRVEAGRGEFLLFALTPPRHDTAVVDPTAVCDAPPAARCRP